MIGLSSGFGVFIILIALFVSVGVMVYCINRRLDKIEDIVKSMKKNTKEVTQVDDQVRREPDSADRENVKEALKNWKAALEKALNTCNKKLTANDSSDSRDKTGSKSTSV